MKTFCVIVIIVNIVCVFYTIHGQEFDNNEDDYFTEVNNHPNWRLVDREHCGESASDRIIGGVNASLGQYPWIARLGYSSTKKPLNKIQFSCGGSLITKCWIMSAAHCVDDLPQYIYLSGIRLGEYDTNSDIDCDGDVCADSTQDFRPVRILMHRTYGEPMFKNDISLIQLHKPALLTKWVLPICLPHGPLLTKSLVGSNAEVAGWGITDIKLNKGSKILQTVSLPIVDVHRCQHAFRKKAVIDIMQLCVGGVVGQDSCGGDSGGPLMKVDVVTTPKYYAFGVVSFGSQYCGKKPTPAVYTDTAKYMNWILDNITPCYQRRYKASPFSRRLNISDHGCY